MDNVSPETRSRMMAAIRGKDTKPELVLRSALFARGYRYRLNCAGLPGRPDIKLTRHNAVVFVHGCFWHGHSCLFFRLPKSNTGFWAAKIDRNRERDLRNYMDLRAAGWRVAVVWECALRGSAFGKRGPRMLDLLCRWIEGNKPFLELFDAASAVDPAGRQAAAGSTRTRSGVGSNRDEARFAAERSPRYGRA
jgi:DNA mismatch endonuclease (patch repair protein)